MKDELFYLFLALQDLLVNPSEFVKGVLKFPFWKNNSQINTVSGFTKICRIGRLRILIFPEINLYKINFYVDLFW